MIDLFEAAWEIHAFLTAHQVPYVFIGGWLFNIGVNPASRTTWMPPSLCQLKRPTTLFIWSPATLHPVLKSQ